MNISVQSIDDASKTLENVVRNTPLQFNKRLSEQFGAKIYLKREDLQDIRSFKIRGAYNKINSLSLVEKKKGVVAASTGNHAQGVAYSCNLQKIKGIIFMPSVIPNQKINRVKQFGGKYIEIKLVGKTFDEAVEEALNFCKKTKSTFIHPFDDITTISGQGTIGKEIYDKLNDKIDILISPIGGGGLISGISTYLKSKINNIQIYGVEAENAASMQQSLKHKKIISLGKFDTFVDGSAVNTVGDYTFNICQEQLKEVLIVSNGLVCSTMIDMYQYEGIIAEPAGALSVSALYELRKIIYGKVVVCILSGGNNDILRYPEIMEKSLVYKGLKHYFLLEFAQKPGQLKEFLNNILGPTDDIVLFEYIKKTQKERGPALVGIELADKNDLTPLIQKMTKAQLSYTKIETSDPLYSFVI